LIPFWLENMRCHQTKEYEWSFYSNSLYFQ
jgi:hypothetical protein